MEILKISISSSVLVCAVCVLALSLGKSEEPWVNQSENTEYLQYDSDILSLHGHYFVLWQSVCVLVTSTIITHTESLIQDPNFLLGPWNPYPTGLFVHPSMLRSTPPLVNFSCTKDIKLHRTRCENNTWIQKSQQIHHFWQTYAFYRIYDGHCVRHYECFTVACWFPEMSTWCSTSCLFSCSHI